MNPKLVSGALKVAVGIVGSLAIGYMIKGEHQLQKAISEHFNKTEITNPGS